MLVERLEVTVKDGGESEFQTILSKNLVSLLQGVDGVRSAQGGQGVENPSKFILLVEWESMEKHTAYQGSPTSLEVRQLMKPFVANAAMEHFEIT